MMDMNDLGLWAKDSKGYEQLRAMDDMNDSGSWAQAFRHYE